MNKSFYQLPTQEIIQSLDSDEKSGLTSQEAKKRFAENGPNEMIEKSGPSIFHLLKEQLSNPIVLILLGTVVIAAVLGDVIEAVLIAAIVIFMAGIGVYLELKAGSAVSELKKLSKLTARVIRGGAAELIDARFLVVGDIIIVDDGDRIPADARIIIADSLVVNESILTGESEGVEKNADTIRDEVVIGDQINMLFAGTFVLSGHARAIIVATAAQTQLGTIATELAETEIQPTPLQLQLEKLGTILFWLTIGLCSLVFFVSFLRGQSMTQALIQSLSLAIAFIPEGLTAVMTVVLAISVKEMVAKKAIIKKLLAAEGLGSVSILATDKTGTITTGEMTVEKVLLGEKLLNAHEFVPKAAFEQLFIKIIAFCNSGKGATENALIHFLKTKGVSYELEEKDHEHRFSSDLKRMTVVKKEGEVTHAYSKGAPDVLIGLCEYVADHEHQDSVPLTPLLQKKLHDQATKLAKEGYRVLGLAYQKYDKPIDISNRALIEKGLVFIGLIALRDPLRSEVPHTVKVLQQAGISAVMITGDHPSIAETIAHDAGIPLGKYPVITGSELTAFFSHQNSLLTEEDIISCRVFARVTPSHKQQLISLFQKHGKLIAMAGDGVNDAIAIAQANIGIAVANASDLVRETADVLITGSYDALANAVEQGRLVMLRTRLYLHYLLSGNLCQVGVFLLALFFNLPFPLTAIQLLIINVLTDAAPAMAMAFERSLGKLMSVPPKPVSESIINKSMWVSISFHGIISSIFLFAVFYLLLPHGILYAQTSTFSAYIFQKLMRGFTARSLTESVFRYGLVSNKFMLGAVVSAFLFWAGLVYGIPHWFHMESLPVSLLVPLFTASLLIPISEEFFKLFKRKIALS